MPTFSFPTTTTTAKQARGAAKKKKMKQADEVNEDEVNEDEVKHVDEEYSVLSNDAEHDVEDVAEDEYKNDPEDVRRDPTFPDVVILKQTDKNYIVKHNHYTVPVKHTANIRDNTILGEGNGEVGSGLGQTAIIAQQAIHSTDLVSPNQIYKGQINKKRGRKPKAGLILNSNTGMYDTSEVPNIILHLKCHLSDLKSNESISNFDYTPSISEVESYNLSSNSLKSCEIAHSYKTVTNDNDDYHDNDVDDDNYNENDKHHIEPLVLNEMNSVVKTTRSNATATTTTTTTTTTATTTAIPTASSTISTKKHATEANIHVINERHQKEIMKKINRLKYSFHNGETIQMKLNHKCACFWDTCEFDGPIYYTPIMVVNGVFHVSGCYCSPECALASLLKEQMDTSTKFERIHLLHLLYGNSNSTGFKPAPNPNYLLDKYYGNLTIDEFRSLLKGPQMIHVVNKPLTHILPELYEDNNDFLVNSKVIPTNTLKLKKRYKTTLVQHIGGGVD